MFKILSKLKHILEFIIEAFLLIWKCYEQHCRKLTDTEQNLTYGKYNYRLKQIDYNGNFEFFNLNSEVGIGNPRKFDLSQNYTNPFNPSTTINFDLPADGFVTLKIFNTSGKEVATLVNETRSSGYNNISFNPAYLSSGVYYYRLESNGISKVM